MSIKSHYSKFPNEFFEEPLATTLSFGAKTLYVCLNSRIELSEKNKAFQDEDGTPFVYYTIDELVKSLGCSKRTVINLLQELEDIGLISRVRQYACKANKIYVHSVNQCSAKFASHNCTICTTEVQDLHHSDANSALMECKTCTQSNSKLTKSKKQNHIYSHTYQAPIHKMYSYGQQYCQPPESEKDDAKKAETKERLRDHFADALTHINDKRDADLFMKIVCDVYTADRRRKYNISGKIVEHIDVFRKIIGLSEMQVWGAVKALSEVRAKTYIANEYMYLLTCLYNG